MMLIREGNKMIPILAKNNNVTNMKENVGNTKTLTLKIHHLVELAVLSAV